MKDLGREKNNEIPCNVKECNINVNNFCGEPSFIIIEETGICQVGLEQIEKRGNKSYIS